MLFSNSIKLKTHIKQDSTGGETFPCDQCPKSFSISSTLKTHRKTHAGEKPLPCDQYSKLFLISYSLKTQRSTTYSGEK